MRLTKKREENFWAKVGKSKFCWEWKAGKDGEGYGRFAIGSGRNASAHRISYLITKGELKEGMTLDHLCKNKGCVNPEHLEQVSSRENSLRAKNTIAYINADKIHCPQGHPLLGKNLIVSKNGYNGARRCRECKNAQERARDRAKRPHTGKYLYP